MNDYPFATSCFRRRKDAIDRNGQSVNLPLLSHVANMALGIGEDMDASTKPEKVFVLGWENAAGKLRQKR